jgi:hypothetical protein
MANHCSTPSLPPISVLVFPAPSLRLGDDNFYAQYVTTQFTVEDFLITASQEVIWHSKLKKEWNNEFDLVVFDPQYGVFICEIKQKSYQRLKESTTNTYSLAKVSIDN